MDNEFFESHEQLVYRLTTGFGALLEQVQELARMNTELEKRLLQAREEADHLTRRDGPLNRENTPVWLQAKRGGTKGQKRHLSNASSDEQPIWFIGSEGQDNAMAIADGVAAWKTLTKGEGPLWHSFNTGEFDEALTHHSEERPTQTGSTPPGDPAVGHSGSEIANCPFATMANLEEVRSGPVETSTSQRHDSLPTGPHTQEHMLNEPPHGDHHDKSTCLPPSAPGSVSKCPIRMLDERPPEEIAEYVELHKHEIPRSHEICVKRYQSNTESIRQLDEKYGDLVNMIQGLGMKHQSFLPAEEEALDFAEMDDRSIKIVEKWADDVKEIPQETALHSALLTGPSNADNREGHFDRPLKEIRVGESPSRPWGILVPAAAATKSSTLESEGAPTPRKPGSQPPQVQAEKIAARSEDHDTGDQTDKKPQMIFTGPVFIGYGAEQAATLIEKCGWDPQGPQR